MNSDAQQLQLFRYAQDLQELMNQNAKLQQHYQMVMQFLRRGSRSDDPLAGMLLAATDLYLVTDGQGEIIYHSLGAEKALAGTGRKLKGQALGRLVPPEQVGKFNSILEGFAATPGTGAIQQRKLALIDASAAGRPRQFDALILRASQLKQFEIYWLLRDEVRPIANAMDIQSSFLIFEDAEDGVMISDPSGKIRAVNPAFTRITGYTSSEALGENPRILSSGRNDADFYRSFWSTLLATNTWNGEIFNRRKNGQIFLAWLSVTAIKNIDGETVSFVATFADMTQHTGATMPVTKPSGIPLFTGAASNSITGL